jgi:hypothetical protein
MTYEIVGDDRTPVVGFLPNIWIEGAGDRFLLGRIDAVNTTSSSSEVVFELEMTVIGSEEIGLDVVPGLRLRLFRGGWQAIWLAGEVLGFRKKVAVED